MNGLLINFGGKSLEFKRVYNKKLVNPTGNPINPIIRKMGEYYNPG
jgi:hypothetical protein